MSSSNTRYKTIDSMLVTHDNILMKFPEGKEIDEYEINASIIGLGAQSIFNTKIGTLRTNNVKNHTEDSIARNSILTNLYIGPNFSPNNFALNINNNEKLSNIVVDDKHIDLVSEDGVVYDKSKKVLVKYPENKGIFTINSAIESIGPRAFWSCTNLGKVLIPDTVKYIRQHAFYFAKAGEFEFTNNSVLESIESFGIAHTPATSIIFPKSLKSLDGQSLQGNGDLKAMYFYGDAPILTDIVEIQGVRSITSVFGTLEYLTGERANEKILYVPAESIGYDHED